ncbi:MAG: beta strand repeat-containing protein [Thermoguttaceae bacterium]
MRNSLMTRGCVALATIVCVAACASAGFAQQFYWQGGPGNWNAAVYSSSDNTTWIANGSLTASGTISGNPGPWVNSTTNSAFIGYSTTNGVGGADGGAGIDQFTYYGPATPITLDPAGIVAQQLTFGENQGSLALARSSQYTLGGGPLTLSNGNITLDLSGSPNFYDFGAQITSNLTCGTAGSLQPLVMGANINNYNAGNYYATYLFLSGSNSYNNIVVGGVWNTTSTTKPMINAIVFSNTQSVSLNSLGQPPTVTLGCNAGIEDYAQDNSQMTFGNIILNPSANYISTAPTPTFSRNVETYGQWGNSRGFIGAGSYYTAGQQYPNITVGAISGSGDMMFTSGNSNDGLGIITVNGASTYTGDTFFSPYSTRTPVTYGTCVLRMGVDNALPAGTNLILGNLGNSGEVDLNSHYLQVNSVATFYDSSDEDDYHGAITNFGSSGTATLAICNSNSQFNTIEAQLHLVIGKSIMDYSTTRSTNSANTNNNIAVKLLAGNNGTVTFGLAQQGETPPGTTFAQSNTYAAGTTIAGGALFADNGSAYWDGAHGTPNDGLGNALATATSATVLNSATGTGPVVVQQGGTLGGSAHLGGAIGMPTTGPVTIQSGGYLLPGGGYYYDSTGAASGSFATTSNAGSMAVALDPGFHPTVGATPLHVLGDLNLNSGSTVNFNFNTITNDSVIVGGALNLTGTVDIGISAIGNESLSSINSGLALFTFGSLSGGTGNLQLSANATAIGDSLAVVGNSIDLVTGGKANLVWSGSLNSGAWDVQTTSNFLAAGVSSTFKAGDQVTFDDTGSTTTVNVASTGVTPGTVTFNNYAKTYTIQGGPILDNSANNNGVTTLVNISGGGTVIFSNSNNTHAGGTHISNQSTLSVTNPTALPATGAVLIDNLSTLQLSYTDNSSVANNASTIEFEGGNSVPIINVPNGTATLAGIICASGSGDTSGGFSKTGSGTLLLTNAVGGPPAGTSYYTGVTKITGGFIEVNSTTPGTDGYANYTALGSGEVDIAQHTGTGGLWLNNVAVGVEQNQDATDTLGYVDMYTGGTLKGTGTSSLSRTHLSSALNCIDIGVAGPSAYLPGSFTLTTGTSSKDVLALTDEVRQFDPNYTINGYVNYLPSAGSANANYVVTAHVAGAGTVMLQSGGISSDEVFGGAWSVDSGVLQLGPFVGTLNTTTGTLAGQTSGAGGEIFNALGFKSTYDTGSSGAVHGNPDLPNPVTVNAGGMLAIANDQINGNAVNGLNSPTNPTQPYYRNPVTLSGGSLAATGAEVTWNLLTSSNSGSQGVVTTSNTAVVARLGGNFTLTPSTTSTILTYDPNGPTVPTTDGSGLTDNLGLARTVELVGGSYTLANASPGLAAGTVISSTTSWAGNLVIASSNGVGGTFNIKRSGGTVTAAPNSTMTIQAGSTVNISNDNSSTLIQDTNSDANYGYMVQNGTLPVLNYVLGGGTTGANVVAINNNGVFNVNAGTQAVGAVIGTGSLNVTGTATLDPPSIVQNAASVASGATLDINGSGAYAPSLKIANSGTIDVTGGTGQTVVSLSGTGTLEIGAGAKLSLSAIEGKANWSTANGLTVSGNTTAWTGDLDVGASGITLSNATSGEVALVTSMIKSGYTSGTWAGTTGITSSAAKAYPSQTSVGFTFNAGTGKLVIAAAIPGDTDLSGVVNNTDRGTFVADFGKAVPAGVSPWQFGSFNYGPVVNNTDRGLLVANFGKGSFPSVEIGGGPISDPGLAAGAVPAATLAPVPEPGTLALLAAGLAAVGIAAVRRRAKNAG